MSAPADDLIELQGLRFHGYHGVFPEERRRGQPFVVDLTLRVDLRPAAATDDLQHTVDYGALALQVRQIVEGDPVDLIETLAARIAEQVLTQPLVRGVTVRVAKPEAPLPVEFRAVAVVITRERAP